jgi:hypothetical protein
VVSYAGADVDGDVTGLEEVLRASEELRLVPLALRPETL